jgi:hypothetical protein
VRQLRREQQRWHQSQWYEGFSACTSEPALLTQFYLSSPDPTAHSEIDAMRRLGDRFPFNRFNAKYVIFTLAALGDRER